MDEKTITESPATSEGATESVAQPEQVETPAAETPVDNSAEVQETKPETTGEPSDDDKLAEWAKK